MKKIMLIYPPGELYQRGEDRCQLNIKASSANAIRACNDLGYASAVLKRRGYSVFLKDYQGENLIINDLLNDVVQQKPDVVFISVTNATIFYDIDIAKKIKDTKTDAIIILKGAIFFDCDEKLLSKIDINTVDYMIGGEEEFIIGDLIDYHYNSPDKLSELPFLIYKNDNIYLKSNKTKFYDDLDSLPFPDRHEMNNSLYVIPDTGEKLATISTSRGCPSACFYCLSPKISGKKVRFRSPQNVIEELRDCYYNFGIKTFFFKSDTFTINIDWVRNLCNEIINSELHKKIRWVANSRVDTINPEILNLMKKAGCYLIAFGLESGSDESLKKMKKNTTVAQNYAAVQMAKKAGLLTFGFYIIGFPWEDRTYLKQTKEAIFKNNTDFIELHIATPFFGTEFYNMLKESNKISDEIYGKTHFNSIETVINSDLSSVFIEKFRKLTVLQYYLRPTYILKKLLQCVFKPLVIINYFKYGINLIKNSIN